MLSLRILPLLLRRTTSTSRSFSFANQVCLLSSFVQPTNTTKQLNGFPDINQPKHLLKSVSNSILNSRCYADGDTATSFHVQDQDDFKSRVLQAKNPVIVWFHAEWCGPCKMLGPRITKQVDNHSGKVMLAMVDIDEEDMGDVAMEYEVLAVPTVISFKGGKSVDQFQGNIDDDLLESFVKNAALS